jgi:cysteine desulfurase
MMRPNVYFDHNATTGLLPVVQEAMCDLMGEPYNPSSTHSHGRKSRSLIDTARVRIKNAIAAGDEYEAVFTSSGTEANNLALKGLSGYKRVTSNVEHASILKVIGSGEIPVDAHGIIKLDALEEILATSQEQVLVSVQAANNETGVIQPLKEICRLVHLYEGLFHSDAVQAFGKIPLSLAEINADLITISAHKFGGPVGAAALIFKKNLPLQPIMIGGGQEMRLRPGTQNTIAIYGFGIAAEVATANLNEFAKLRFLSDYIEAEIAAISPHTVIFGKNAQRLPNTSSLTMPGVNNETQVIHFDINGFSLSAGSACSSGRIDLPYVQMAMGYEEEEARTAIRISLGMDNNKEQADRFILLWKELFFKNYNNQKHQLKAI